MITRTQAPPRSALLKRTLNEAAKNTYIIIICACLLLPLFIMLFTSVKDQRQAVQEFFRIAPPFHWENYATAFRHIAPFVGNSMVMALATTALSVALACLAAYAFGRLKFPFQNFLFGILFAKMLLPGIMNLIPSFTLAWKMGILDTVLPVILFGAATSQPFWVFVLRTFVKGQPQELFEAMRIDGAGELAVFFRLAIPLLRPMIMLMSINVFLAVWNDYIWPLVTITTPAKRPLTVGIATLAQAFPGEFGMLTAAYTLAALPLVILFLFGMKQFIEGLTAGAIKL